MSSGPFDVAGKSAVVTGGAMGIGYGIVRRLVEAGANEVHVHLLAPSAAQRRVVEADLRAGQCDHEHDRQISATRH